MARKYALAFFVIVTGLLVFVFREKSIRLKPEMPTESPLPIWPSTLDSSPAPSMPDAPTASAAPGPPAKAADRESFRGYLERTYAQIPRRADLAKLTDEEVHHMPAPLQKAAQLMGDVAERLDHDPTLAPEALGFYKRCALSAEFPESVRALCLSDTDRLGQKYGQPGFSEADLTQIPDRIRQLAKQLDF